MVTHEEGCQIFLSPTYQNEEKYAKGAQNIPNGRKIDQLSIKYTNIVNLPKVGFLV
jgi:hypothetical protein